MLRAKDMITKLLDGLEMFLGVGVMFLNSSNLEIPGRWLGDVLGCGCDVPELQQP